jgi:hypothetical protein
MMMSAIPEVPVLLFVGVNPAALVVLTAVDVPEILAFATMLLLASLKCWSHRLLAYMLLLAYLLLLVFLLLLTSVGLPDVDGSLTCCWHPCCWWRTLLPTFLLLQRLWFFLANLLLVASLLLLSDNGHRTEILFYVIGLSDYKLSDHWLGKTINGQGNPTIGLSIIGPRKNYRCPTL